MASRSGSTPQRTRRVSRTIRRLWPCWLAGWIGLDLTLLLAAIAAAFYFATPLWEMTLGVHLPGLPWLPDQR